MTELKKFDFRLSIICYDLRGSQYLFNSIQQTRNENQLCARPNDIKKKKKYKNVKQSPCL